MTQSAPFTPDKLALLRGVSRSFYLSIRLLPQALREPVAVAYLLARATDTLADTTILPAAERHERLSALANAIDRDAPARTELEPGLASFAAHQQDPGERQLMLAMPQVLAWLDALDSADRTDIRTVLRHITRGQSLDLARFNSAAPLAALAHADELVEYTYLVAGSVGEFWTDLCFRHLPGFASLPQPRMRDLGRAYGEGLQLINILRDAAQDLAAGRCYLPADALAQAGLTVQDLADEPARLAPFQHHWLQQADDRLAQGMRYCTAVNPRRVRAASALPALIGARTLALLRQAGPSSMAQRVKLPRREVRSILWRLALTGAANGPMQAQFLRLRS